MFRNAHFDNLRQAFGDQFTSDEHGVIYRKHQIGAPIRISEMERSEFVSKYNKRLNRSAWCALLAPVGLIFLLVWIVPDINNLSTQVAAWLGLAVIIAPFVIYHLWAWNSPSRELKHRAPEGVALTKVQAQALGFSKITYWQLALAALLGVGLVWKASMTFDVPHGWGLVWPLLGAGVIVIAGVQAIRKWRLNRK